MQWYKTHGGGLEINSILLNGIYHTQLCVYQICFEFIFDGDVDIDGKSHMPFIFMYPSPLKKKNQYSHPSQTTLKIRNVIFMNKIIHKSSLSNASVVPHLKPKYSFSK